MIVIHLPRSPGLGIKLCPCYLRAANCVFICRTRRERLAWSNTDDIQKTRSTNRMRYNTHNTMLETYKQKYAIYIHKLFTLLTQELSLNCAIIAVVYISATIYSVFTSSYGRLQQVTLVASVKASLGDAKRCWDVGIWLLSVWCVLYACVFSLSTHVFSPNPTIIKTRP